MKSANATIRYKPGKEETSRMYLDITGDGKRRKKTLGLYIYKRPKGPAQKQHNREQLHKAEAYRIEILSKIQNSNLGLEILNRKRIKLLDYYNERLEKSKTSEGNAGQWDSSLKHIQKFNQVNIYPDQINERWLEDLKEYLLNCKQFKSPETYIGQNTAGSYFNKVIATLNKAEIERLIDYNPARNTKRIPEKETWREYLTFDELKKVEEVPCLVPILKRAALFSALTGLRWSDIIKIEEKHINRQDMYLRYRQKKTDTMETKYLSKQAIDLLDNSENTEHKTFDSLPPNPTTTIKSRLTDWMDKSGITKNITFHCFRHTYATIQLTLGTDIYILSKELGHRNIKNTEIYAKIVDERKREAAERIPELEIRL